jgi:hypothetical protein
MLTISLKGKADLAEKAADQYVAGRQAGEVGKKNLQRQPFCRLHLTRGKSP